MRQIIPINVETPSLWTKAPLCRTLLSSVTQAYLSSLTLTCHVDMTLQPCVNREEKSVSVG